MRDPGTPEGPKVPETVPLTGTPGVSIPDRRRIDSDVRAFLREPSTPWIVFDQEGRPPSQLAVGEILKGPRRTLLSDYDFFPATAAVDEASSHSKVVGVNSLVAVSSDVSTSASSSTQLNAVLAPVRDSELPELSEASTSRAFPRFGVSRRVLGAAAGAVAVLSLFVVGAVALHTASSAPSASTPSAVVDGAGFRSALAAQPATTAVTAPVIADVPPPDLDVKPPPPVVVPTPVVTASPASPAPQVALTVAKSGAGKYGRLTIAGDARGKDVFMDGKRMLGRGARSFSVMCGAHTIAVSVRSDAHDVEIPCNAELVVGK